MKVEIGKEWIDPTLDSPILRQMPRHWKLHTEPDATAMHWWRNGDVWVGVFYGTVGAWVVAQVIRQLAILLAPWF